MSIDQRKAFDSIFHEYIYALINHIELGSFITESIKRINSYAIMEINKKRSKKNTNKKRNQTRLCPLNVYML